jgi:hypothetical protein
MNIECKQAGYGFQLSIVTLMVYISIDNLLMRTACLILLLTAFPAMLKACGCDTIPFVSALKYDEIFFGELYKIETFPHNYPDIETHQTESDQEYTAWRYYFKVIKKWKGSRNDIAIVTQIETSCAFPFDVYSQYYLVYSSYLKKDNWLSNLNDFFLFKESDTYLCARNTRVYGQDGMNWFDSDTALLNQNFPHPVKLASYQNRWLVGSICFVFLLFGVFWWIRKRRKNTSTQSPPQPPPAH